MDLLFRLGDYVSRASFLDELIVGLLLFIAGLAVNWRRFKETIAELRGQVKTVENKVGAAITGDILQRPLPAPARLKRTSPTETPKVISVINFKGGVGKSTLTGNLGAYFSDMGQSHGGKRVLLLDFDWQGSLSESVNGDTRQLNSVWTLIGQTARPLEVLEETFGYAHPSAKRLSLLSADFDLQQREDRLLLEFALRRTDTDPRLRLKTFIDQLTALRDDAYKFDIILIDCPPRQTMLTVNALIASTHLLVPTRFNRMSIRALPFLFETLGTLRDKLQLNVAPLGVIGTMQPQMHVGAATWTMFVDAVEDVAAQGRWPGLEALSATMRTNNAFATASAGALPYFENDDAREIITEIGQEIESRLH